MTATVTAREYIRVADRLGKRDSRKVGNNTYLKRRGNETIALRLHATDIVTWHSDGRTVLDSGGWLTVTTKARMNEWAPVRIYSVLGRWVFPDGTVYADGITISPDGITGQGEHNPSSDKAIKRRIKAYAQSCADAVPIDAPSGADCWYCLFPMSGREHLESHIAEAYIVPSLVLKAMRDAGNTESVIAGAFQDTGFFTDIARERVRRSVARYMSRAMGFAK